MKLRSLLTEINEQREAERLEDLLSSGKYMVENQRLLYRGTDRGLNGRFEERTIRKDRRPSDTNPQIDRLVNILIELKFPYIPKRSEAKFAATMEHTAYLEMNYGAPHVIFPEIDAPIVSSEKDAFDYFTGLGSSYKMGPLTNYGAKDTELSKDLSFLSEDVYNLLLGLLQIRYFDSLSSGFVSVVKNFTIKEMIQLLEKAKQDVMNQKDYREEVIESLDNLSYMFEALKKYFDSITPGVKSDSKEIMFGGDEYLIIDINFFQKYFEYEDGRWRMKDKWL